MRNMFINLSSSITISNPNYTITDIAKSIKINSIFNGELILEVPLKPTRLVESSAMTKEEILKQLDKVQSVKFTHYECSDYKKNFTHWCKNIKNYEGIPVKALVNEVNNTKVDWRNYTISFKDAITLADKIYANRSLEEALLKGLKISDLNENNKKELTHHKYEDNWMRIPYNLWINNKTNDKYLLDFGEITSNRLNCPKYYCSPCEIMLKDKRIYQKNDSKSISIPFDFNLLNELINRGFIFNEEVYIDVTDRVNIIRFATIKGTPKFEYKFSKDFVDIKDIKDIKDINMFSNIVREDVLEDYIVLPYIASGIEFVKPSSSEPKWIHHIYNIYKEWKKGLESED